MSVLVERQWYVLFYFFFFFNDTATTEIYTLSLHDALPISLLNSRSGLIRTRSDTLSPCSKHFVGACRSEEHTSELQSRQYLVCRLLLEKKKNSHYQRLCYPSLITRRSVLRSLTRRPSHSTS